MRTIRSKVVVFSVLAVMVLFIVGCANVMEFLTGTPKSFDEIWKTLTPKGKVALAFSTYNKQYDDFKVQVAKTNLTEAEKGVLRDRKKILVNIYPLIQAFDLALVEGKMFDPANEALLIGYLRQLWRAK